MTTTMEVPKTMRAATVTAFNTPLEILNDVPVPEVPQDMILVKIEAASLCSSDLMAYKGYMPWMTKVPYCAGHEPVGVVARVGDHVKSFNVGDRVGFMMFYDMCGVCDECFRGQHRYCSSKKVVGFSNSHGGFSEYALADPRSTVKLPDNLSFDTAAPLLCAGITAYSALLKTASKPGQLINIVGCGGVGHIAILLAKAIGYRVHAFDIAQNKLDVATKCGADKVYDTLKISLTEVEKGSSTIVVSGANAAYDNAVQITANHGSIVAVGLPAEKLSINLPLWSSKGLKLLPVNTGSREELVECLELAALHNIKPLIEVRQIEAINEGYQDLAAGNIDGRVVYHF